MVGSPQAGEVSAPSGASQARRDRDNNTTGGRLTQLIEIKGDKVTEVRRLINKASKKGAEGLGAKTLADATRISRDLLTTLQRADNTLKGVV